MADKIVKAFEALRSHYLQESTQAVVLAQKPTSVSESGADVPGPNTKKKDASLSTRERINFCNVISDYLPMQTVRGINEFPRLLTLAMELLLVSCDDNDADVRLVAGESINKIMKALLDTNIGRIQVELYKEIKKNGSSRSLRAAMQRFSDTSHLIRAHKRRPYVANMLPCIVKIAKREDDSVQESLGVMMQKVVPVLGIFMNEGDVKILLKCFLPNLKSTSAVTRRTAASSLNVLCQYSRKPIHFYSWLISMLLGMITPLTDDLPAHTILGVLVCMRSVVPHLDTNQTKNAIKGSFGAKNTTTQIHKKMQSLEKKQYLQIYEVTMFCTKHKDHNVVTAALENLYQVLQCHAKPLIEILLSPSGIAPTITGQLDSLGVQSKQKDSPAPSEAGDSGVPSDVNSLSSLSLASESMDGKDMKPESLDVSLSSLDDSSHSEESPMFSAIPVIPSVQVSETDSALDASSIDTNVEEAEENEESDNENEGLRLPRTYTQGSMVNIEGDLLADPRDRLGSTFLEIQDGGSQASLEEELIRHESICSSDVRSMIERQFNIDAVACTGVPLLNCVRLMCSFLLSGEPGKTLPDSKTRVSVKSLALHCIGTALKLFPEALVAKVLPDEFADDASSSKQLVRDIFLLHTHEDPQIRGAVAGVIGHYTHAAMTVAKGKYRTWITTIAENYGTESLNLRDCLEIVIHLFKDESAVAVKHICHAAKYCILSLYGSDYNMFAYELVRDMIALKDCSYWLVKTEILDTLHQLDYRRLMIFEPHWFQSQNLSNLNKKFVNIQNQVLNVMSVWLGDEDARVRQAAAVSLVKIVPNLFFAGSMQKQKIDCLALRYTKDAFEGTEEWNALIGTNLSVILRKLFELQDTTTNKFLIHGCIQSYYLLSETYPPTQFPYAWEILPSMSLKINQESHSLKANSAAARRLDFSPSKSLAASGEKTTCGILNMTLDLISAGWVMFDIQAHQDTLKLCVHILCGASKPHLKSRQNELDQGKQEAVNVDSALIDSWSGLKHVQLISYAKRIFVHITRILHILTHVIEQTNPLLGVKPTSTFSAPNKDKTPLPGNVTNTSYTPTPTTTTNTPQQTSVSPRKFTLPKAMQRKLDSDADQSKTPDTSTTLTSSDAKQTPTLANTPQPSDKSEKLGTFHHLPHFMKLHEILKGAFKNYQVSSIFSGVDKFTSFVRGTLEAFSMMLELATFSELGTHAEEFLEYMKATAQVEEELTFLSVQQLLKGLFGTNAASDPDAYILAASTKHLIETRGDPTFAIDKQPECNGLSESLSSQENIYNGCFMSAYNEMCESLKMVPLADTNSLERGSKALNLFKSFKKNISASRTTAKVSKERIASIQSFIRLFEPLVIHALKAYTTTSSTTLQCQAIHLLNQLIRLRVNYSLLDSDQVFIAFVLKQFEFINNGQISMPELFIPTIFQFLVLLSYECYQPKFTQAKAIIGMPKIMRLCDEVMACEQPAITHAIPALKPIVQDLFASHSQSRPDSAKELDTQKEVVVSMLLRVVQYPEVLQMLATVLNGSKTDDEKWKRLSRLIIDTLLPNLSKLEVKIRSMGQLELLLSLLDGVAPLALRPADIILKSLFDVHLPKSVAEVTQAVAMLIGLLRTLIMQNREDTIFSRMQQIDSSFVRPCFNIACDAAAPAEFYLKTSKTNQNSAHYLASFIIYFVDLAVLEMSRSYDDLCADRKQLDVLSEMLETFFVLITYIARSGSFKILTSNLHSVLHQKRQKEQHHDPDVFVFMDIHAKLGSIKEQEASCFLKWLFCLQGVGVTDPVFWKDNFSSSSTIGGNRNKENIPWKLDVIQKGSLLLYCDVITSQLKEQKNVDVSVVENLLECKVSELMLHFDEPPIKELVSRILQSAELTTVFLKMLSSAVTPQFLRHQLSSLKWLLHHLECVELSYSAAIINFLLKILPYIRIYGLARKAETLACRRVEYIHSLPDQQSELSLADLKEFSKNSLFMKRYPRLCSSIHRIDKNMSPELMTAKHPLDNAEVNLSDYLVKQEWMRGFVQKLCFSLHAKNQVQRKSEVRLLRSLNLEDIQGIMEDEKFDINLLETCVTEAFFTDKVSKQKHRSGTNSARMELHDKFSTGGSSEKENREKLLNLSKAIAMRHVYSLLDGTTEYCEFKNFKYLAFKEGALRTLKSDGEKMNKYLLIVKCIIRFLTPSCYYNQSWNLKMEDGLEVTKFLLILPLLCKEDLDTGKGLFLNLEVCFHALALLFHCQELSLCLMDQTLALILTKSIDAIFTIVQHLALNYGEEATHLSKNMKHNPQDESSTSAIEEDVNPFRVSCEQVSDLVHALQNIVSVHNFRDDRIPKYLVGYLRKAIIGLARLSFVNSYVRIPPIVWKFGWDPTLEGIYSTELPPLPVEIMKEKDVLKEFVYRVNQIGWTSRMQYEETWAALLGVLSSPPVIEDSSTEEDIELAESCCLAVHCITSLLLETTLAPVPGNSAISQYSIIHRHRDYPFLTKKVGKKLLAIRSEIEMVLNEQTSNNGNLINTFFHPVVPSLLSAKQRKQHLSNGCMMEAKLYVSNLELMCYTKHYNLGQISASAIRTRLVTSDVQEDTDSDDSDSVIIKVKEKSHSASISSDAPYRKLEELDIRSCLQFLLELFEQWLSPFAIPKTPLMLKMEAIKSLCVLSDLLLELNHYEWILGILLDFSQNHPAEDEILMQYLIPTICKALAVLKLEGQHAERICRLIEAAIKSPHLPLQVSCLAGSLYILESYVNSTNLILAPILTEFLIKKLTAAQDKPCTTESQRHLTMLWTVAFYLIENCSSEIQDPTFASSVLEIAINELCRPTDGSCPGLSNVLFNGLERLAVSSSLTRAECERLAKVASNCISIGSSDNILPALGLLCTCMYTSKDGEQVSGPPVDVTVEAPITDSNLVVMERINILLARIRKGNLWEATLLSTILPRIMLDFLPVQEVMNKLISEFLSSQQLRPELVAKIFNKVSDLLYKDGKEQVVRDWVFLCIGSFVQRTPLSMAVWSLACFFISSSTNPWLKSLFPFIVERKGKFTEDDKKLFVMAALDFYMTQNLDEEQKKQFVQTFRSKSDHPSSPYELLISCCLKISSS